MGVSRLTGMNSEAISAKTHSVIAKAPLQYAGCSCACWWSGVETRGVSETSTLMSAHARYLGETKPDRNQNHALAVVNGDLSILSHRISISRMNLYLIVRKTLTWLNY